MQLLNTSKVWCIIHMLSFGICQKKIVLQNRTTVMNFPAIFGGSVILDADDDDNVIVSRVLDGFLCDISLRCQRQILSKLYSNFKLNFFMLKKLYSSSREPLKNTEITTRRQATASFTSTSWSSMHIYAFMSHVWGSHATCCYYMCYLPSFPGICKHLACVASKGLCHCHFAIWGESSFWLLHSLTTHLLADWLAGWLTSWMLGCLFGWHGDWMTASFTR